MDLSARFETMPSSENLPEILLDDKGELIIYVAVYQELIEKLRLKICYEYHCSPFRELAFFIDWLCVGFEEHFYMFNLQNQQIIKQKLEGYFASVHLIDVKIMVCSASEIFCFHQSGQLLWRTENLGIDGVIIQEVKENVIIGRGEFDPPDTWLEFKLDIDTGLKK